MRRGITRSMAAGACAVALAGVLALAGPATAKGIQSGTITGPGLDQPIDLGGSVGNLPDLTGFWELMPGQPQPLTLTDQAPTGQLGPRYRVTWQFIAGPEETTPIRQDLYPYAENGPLVHSAAGQPIFGAATIGGWYQAPVALRDTLGSLGVPPLGAGAADRSSSATAAAARAPSPDDSLWPAVIAVAGAVALVSVGGVVAVRRTRRRERVAPIPL